MMSPAAAPVSPSAGFIFGSFWVDESKHVLVDKDGNSNALSVREIGLLRILSSHPGEVVTRDRMLNEVWGFEYTGTTRTLDQHIVRLRKKLGADERRIVAVRGAGYRYLAD
jgi:DNA-binding response OmpR family regulator